MSFGFHPFADELRTKLRIGIIDPLRASVAALQAVQTLRVRLGPATAPLARPKELMHFLERLAETITAS
jgi:hypothetical protein